MPTLHWIGKDKAINHYMDARYELWSADGHLIASMAAGYANLTTFWTLPQVTSGIYLLQLLDEGRVVQSEKLVVE